MVTTSGANYPNGTFYTKVRGDGTTTAIIKLVISGGAIQEFGDGATTLRQVCTELLVWDTPLH